MSERERKRRAQQSWASRREAAERFGVSVRTIVRWENDQKLRFPCGKVVRGRVYFETSELDDFQARNAREAVAC
jgi:predicted site-specific integrase-resolvase